MRKNAFFVVLILTLVFIMFGCQDVSTANTTVQTTASSSTTVFQTTTVTTTATTTISSSTQTTMPTTDLTTEPTTVSTTEIATTTGPIVILDDLLALFAENEVDFDQITGSFSMPKSFGGAQLAWSLAEENQYVNLTDDTETVLFEMTPVALGDVDQNVTLSVHATLGEAEGDYSIDVVLKARTTPISAFNLLADNAAVTLGGIVYSKARVGYDGYYIYDTSGFAFIYGNSNDVSLGEEIIITGTKDIYFNIHEMTYTGIDKIQVLSTGNPAPEYLASSVSDILDGPGNASSLAKNYTIQAKVIRKVENYITNFYFQDLITGEDVFIYYKSAQDIAGLYEDQYVEAKITVYDFNTSTQTFSVFLSNNINDIHEVTPDLSDQDKADAVSYYLIHLYDNRTISDNLELVLTDLNWESTISWTSDNIDVLTSTGVTLQDELVSVGITALIEVGEIDKEVELTIKVAPVNIENLQEILEWQVDNQSLTKEVAFEAIVVATRGTSGYFVIQNGYGYYIKGNEIDVQPGDLVRIIGITKYSRQPYIDIRRMEKILTSGNTIPNPMTYNATAFALEDVNSTFYNTYVELEGTLQGTRSTYGYTYTLLIGTKTVTIHSASNTCGFSYLLGSDIKLKAFINRINTDLVNWEIFIVNRDGDTTVMETDQAKLAMGMDYLDDLFVNNVDITTDIRLPEHHPSIMEVTYTYASSVETALSNEGKYMFPAIDTQIQFSITVHVGGLSQTRDYTYMIKNTPEGSSSDLMFTFLLHGIVNDKMYAIYNGTGADVDLSGYKVFAVQNSGVGGNEYTVDGRNVVGKLLLSGLLPAGETLLVYHSSTNIVILNQIPGETIKIATPNQNGVAQFNGKDGDLVVLQRDGMIIDQIGSFEKINSLGGSTSWEKEFFGQKMLIRISSQPTPALDWTDFASVYDNYALYLSGVAPDYLLPSIAYDFLNGDMPE